MALRVYLLVLKKSRERRRSFVVTRNWDFVVVLVLLVLVLVVLVLLAYNLSIVVVVLMECNLGFVVEVDRNNYKDYS